MFISMLRERIYYSSGCIAVQNRAHVENVRNAGGYTSGWVGIGVLESISIGAEMCEYIRIPESVSESGTPQRKMLTNHYGRRCLSSAHASQLLCTLTECCTFRVC